MTIYAYHQLLCPVEHACRRLLLWKTQLCMLTRAAGPQEFTASTAERPGLETGDVVAFLADQVRVEPVPNACTYFCIHSGKICGERV